MSALDLAWHIASAEHLFLDGVASGEFNFSGGGKPDSIRNSADVLSWYKQSFEKNFDRLTKLSGEQLAKEIDFHGMFKNQAVLYLSFDMHHTIHHRGQLSAYLRPMGAKVPSIYGESYDAKQARLAAQA